MAHILWQRSDVPGMEWCDIHEGDSGAFAEGVALAVVDGRPRRYEYLVLLDDAGGTRRVVVHEGTHRLELESDGRGGWARDGQSLDLAGATDVDLGFSPLTNSLPLWRLGLEPGGSAEVTVALVDDRDLTVRPAVQHYTRLSADRARFTSGDVTAELQLDDRGIVRRYDGLWETVAVGP